MRFYSIVIDGGPTFSSVVNGQNDPNALRVALSIDKQSMYMSQGTSYANISGVNFDTMANAGALNGQKVSIYGGFWPGLPLAVAQSAGPRQGLLASGTIAAASGTWRGTDVGLNLLFFPGEPVTSGSNGSSSSTSSQGGGFSGSGGSSSAAPSSAAP